jgi:hypothetical protein
MQRLSNVALQATGEYLGARATRRERAKESFGSAPARARSRAWALDGQRNDVIGRDLLQPSPRREPTHDSAGSAKPTSMLAFACSRCQTAVALELEAILRAAWDVERELGDALLEAAWAHFGLGVVGKSHDGGFASLHRVRCPACAAEFLVYAGVREPANGWLQITLQGVAELEVVPPAV